MVIQFQPLSRIVQASREGYNKNNKNTEREEELLL